MADLTERQKEDYWRYNVRLTTTLLVIWFVVTYLISGLWAGWLNQYSFLGFPMGYYMAAQGSLAIFVSRPIAGVITAVAIFFFVLPVLTPWWRRMRGTAVPAARPS